MITIEEWIEKYRPIQNPFTSEGSYDNTAFETYGQEYEYLSKFHNNQIWTLLSCEDEEQYIMPGRSVVNREAYFITNIPFQNSDLNTLQVNDNEMISIIEAKEHCIKFALSINVPLSVNEVSDFFTNLNLQEISTMAAKYRTADLICQHFEDNFLEQDDLTDDQWDQIHNYFSQL